MFDVELIANPSNYGLGYATQQGCARAKGDLLLVANPDIIFTGLDHLLAYAYNHPEIDCMMPSLEPAASEGGYQNPVHWHRFPHFLNFTSGLWLDKMFNQFLTKYCLAGGNSPNEHNIPVDDKHVYGVSCMLLRRSLVERMGGIYNPKYFWAWADADFGMRLAKYHAKGIGVPEAKMKHFGAHSTKHLTSHQIIYLAANGQKHWEKDWGHSSRYFTAMLLDSILVGAKGPFRRSSFRNRIMFLKGWLS